MFDRKRIRLAIGLGMLAFVLTIGGGIFIATVTSASNWLSRSDYQFVLGSSPSTATMKSILTASCRSFLAA